MQTTARGTDRHSAPSVATDEAAIVARFEERLGPWLVYCDTVRMTEGDEIFGAGPTGQVVPGYSLSYLAQYSVPESIHV